MNKTDYCRLVQDLAAHVHRVMVRSTPEAAVILQETYAAVCAAERALRAEIPVEGRAVESYLLELVKR